MREVKYSTLLPGSIFGDMHALGNIHCNFKAVVSCKGNLVAAAIEKHRFRELFRDRMNHADLQACCFLSQKEFFNHMSFEKLNSIRKHLKI